VCNPPAREAVDMLAEPKRRLWVPITVAPSLKVTVPSGVPADDVTVAVKVIVCPMAAGFGDAVSVVVVGFRFTTSVRTVDWLARVTLSPA
jgi:hypothetical protein